MLNPVSDDERDYSSLSSPTSAAFPSPTTPAVLLRRQRVPKDAPIFLEGNKVVGMVNFSPHETGQDRNLIAQHRRFQVFPLGEIYKKGIRHIPYNSDKKDFMEKTGRDAFESKAFIIKQRMLLTK